jgi:uncharacterized RmlC-like cupin family protein
MTITNDRCGSSFSFFGLLLVPLDMARIDLVRGDGLEASTTTQGILRRKAFESSGVVFGRTEVMGGALSVWHHHGRRHLYGSLVAGRLRLEYGAGGGLVADMRPGDFFHIPPRLVHRDANPSKDETAIVVNILIGAGPRVVDVDGPEAA